MQFRTMMKCIQWTSLVTGIALMTWPLYVAAESARVQRSGAQQFSKKPEPKAVKGSDVKPGQTGVDARSPKAPPRGSMLAQLEMPRLGISYVLLEGADNRTLDKSIGHVENTAYPGQAGNIGVAGHRNTHFRKLEWVRTGDEILLRSKDAEYRYLVKSARLVSPKDVSVLSQSEGPAITLVTCFPFEYVGAAPLRFIVKAVPDQPTITKMGIQGGGNVVASAQTAEPATSVSPR